MSEFDDAVSKSRSLPSQDNSSLLELYSLYKQATAGDVNGKRPGMLDPKGRAKYDSWSKKKGVSADDAKRQYIDLVTRLANG
jgi:diazepam-binding inhibitor (GABA receptor modulating acyl-CoA-binding protein)